MNGEITCCAKIVATPQAFRYLFKLTFYLFKLCQWHPFGRIVNTDFIKNIDVKHRYKSTLNVEIFQITIGLNIVNNRLKEDQNEKKYGWN